MVTKNCEFLLLNLDSKTLETKPELVLQIFIMNSENRSLHQLAKHKMAEGIELVDFINFGWGFT